LLRILLIIPTFEDLPVTLDRAYQRRIAVNVRMLPFLFGDRQRLDFDVGLGDRVVGDVRQPIAFRGTVANVLQDHRDIHITVRAGITAGAAAEQNDLQDVITVGPAGVPLEKLKRRRAVGDTPSVRANCTEASAVMSR
jgi:hypothetical protein